MAQGTTTSGGGTGPGSNMQTAHAAGVVILTAVGLLFVAGFLFRKPARKIT